MSHDVAPGWIDRRVRAAVRGDVDALREQVDSLRAAIEADRGTRQTELSAVGTDLAQLQAGISEIRGIMAGLVTDAQERAERVQGELQALRGALDALDERIGERFAERDGRIEHELGERDDRMEAVRTRLEGLMVQHRWDVEQLRQSLAAVAERLPLAD